MKRIALWLTLFAVPCAAQSPLGRLDFHLQNAQGQAVSGASVNVYLQPSGVTSLTVSTVQILAVPFIPSPYYALVTFTTDVPAYAAGQSYRFSGLTTYTALNGLTLTALPYAGTPGPRVPNITPASNQALFLFGSTPYGPASDTGTGSAFTSSACGSAKGAAASLYTAAVGGTLLSQPVLTNGFGEAKAYVAQGCYTVVYNSPYTGTLTYSDQSAIAASSVTAGVGAGCSSGVCTIPQGGTNGSTRTDAFNNIVGLGGTINAPLILTKWPIVDLTNQIVADGVTDNAPAINAGLASAASIATNLQISSGVYIPPANIGAGKIAVANTVRYPKTTTTGGNGNTVNVELVGVPCIPNSYGLPIGYGGHCTTLTWTGGTTHSELTSVTYVSGGTITGTGAGGAIGSCLLTIGAATAMVTVDNTGAVLYVTVVGNSSTFSNASPPTTGVLSNGAAPLPAPYATCSGTATITTTVAPVMLDVMDTSGAYPHSFAMDCTASSPATSGSVGLWIHGDNITTSSHNQFSHLVIAGCHKQIAVGAADSLGISDLNHHAQADSITMDHLALFGRTDQNNPNDLTTEGISINSTNAMQQSTIDSVLFRGLNMWVHATQSFGQWTLSNCNSDTGIGAQSKGVYIDHNYVGLPPKIYGCQSEGGGPLWTFFDMSCSSPNYPFRLEYNEPGQSSFFGGCNHVDSNNATSGNPFLTPQIIAGRATVTSHGEPSGTSTPGWSQMQSIPAFGVHAYPGGALVLDSNGYLEQAQTTVSSSYPITSYTILGNNATFQGSFSGLTTGTALNLSGFAASTFLNSQNVSVASSTSTQFTATFVHADASATEAGSASTVCGVVAPTWPGVGGSVSEPECGQTWFNLGWRPGAMTVAAITGTPTSGGSMTGGPYYGKYECTNTFGHALSAEVSVALSGNTQIVWALPYPRHLGTSGSCKLYVGTSPGGENSYFALTNGATALTQTTNSGTAGSPDASGSWDFNTSDTYQIGDVISDGTTNCAGGPCLWMAQETATVACTGSPSWTATVGSTVKPATCNVPFVNYNMDTEGRAGYGGVAQLASGSGYGSALDLGILASRDNPVKFKGTGLTGYQFAWDLGAIEYLLTSNMGTFGGIGTVVHAYSPQYAVCVSQLLALGQPIFGCKGFYLDTVGLMHVLNGATVAGGLTVTGGLTSDTVSATSLTASVVANVTAPTGVATDSGQSVPASATNQASLTCIDATGTHTTLGLLSGNVTTAGGASFIVWSYTLPTGCTTAYIWMTNTGTFANYSAASGTSFQQNAAASSYTAAASYPVGGAYPLANTTGAIVGGTITGSLIVGATVAGQVAPTGTPGALFTRTGAHTGSVFLGDGTCFVSMTAANTAVLNCGTGGTWSVLNSISLTGANGTTQTATQFGCETSFGTTTVNTGSATTTTGVNCLRPNAVIDSVVYYVTTTITTAVSFTVGVAGTTSKFCGTQSTLTAGTTGICAAQTGTTGALNVSAAPVVVTFNATPGAGAIRIIVNYHTWGVPTS